MTKACIVSNIVLIMLTLIDMYGIIKLRNMEKNKIAVALFIINAIMVLGVLTATIMLCTGREVNVYEVLN